MQTKQNILTAQRFYTIMSVGGFASGENTVLLNSWAALRARKIMLNTVHLIVRTSILNMSNNHPGNYHSNKYYINSYRFHNFTTFGARDSR